MASPQPLLSDPFGLTGITLAGKYHVGELVGGGGFGVVYRGTHGGFGEPIAIKCLRVADDLPTADRAELLAQLRAEGAVLHRLSKRSAAIVQALDVDAAVAPSGQWVPYLVLEWLEGETLAEHLAKRSPLSVHRAVALLEPAFHALAAAHARGVAHRDVKPENLFIERSEANALKVLDFGIAKVLHGHAAFTASPAATHERTTAFTPVYGAPEQFNKRLGATGPWTDVFALALVLVEMVCGKRALEGDTPTQLYVAATNPDARPSMRHHGVDPGAPIESVLQRALAIAPSERFADAGAFWDELERALRQTPQDGGRTSSDFPTVGRSAKVNAPSGPPDPLAPTATPEELAATATSEQPFAITSPRSSTPAPNATTPLGSAPMTRADFEVQLIELARNGVPLTMANVVAETGLTRHYAATWLEELSDRTELARESDPKLGVVYRVPGLTVPPRSNVLARRASRLILSWLRIDRDIPSTLPLQERKSVPLGIALGAFVPFLGLLYAAPFWSAVLISGGLGVFVGVLKQVPFIGSFLNVVVWGLAAGAFGGTYTWHYNRHGKRMALRLVDYDSQPATASTNPASADSSAHPSATPPSSAAPSRPPDPPT